MRKISLRHGGFTLSPCLERTRTPVQHGRRRQEGRVPSAPTMLPTTIMAITTMPMEALTITTITQTTGRVTYATTGRRVHTIIPTITMMARLIPMTTTQRPAPPADGILRSEEHTSELQ